MSQRMSIVLACLAFSALPFVSGCGEGGGHGIAAAAPPQNPTVPATDLSGVTQTWDKDLSSSSRFTVLASFNNEAVRDNNTGLVWQKTPTPGAQGIWVFAIRTYCINDNIGGQKGWRVPSIHELATLIDPQATTSPFLPTGHPFVVTQTGYWSGTSSVQDPTGTAWIVDFATGGVGPNSKGATLYAWCVRGPSSESLY